VSLFYPDRWQKVDKVFAEILTVHPGQREAFLREACGTDSDLRRAVEARLAGSAAHLGDVHFEQGVVGRTISHYEVGEKIGAGGMGTVYRCRDLRLNRMVALKFLKGDLVASKEARHRFVREGHALSSLSHPNIATLFEVDEVDGMPFLAMEYLSGGTLRERIREATRNASSLVLSQVLDWPHQAHRFRRG
jgi:serine/threonine protein kinase